MIWYAGLTALIEINIGKKYSWDSSINQVTLFYFVKNTSHCVNCKVSGDNQLAGSADWDESLMTVYLIISTLYLDLVWAAWLKK